MNEFGSWGLEALKGAERLRGKDGGAFRDRMCALPLLLRGAYFSGEAKWRSMAEEDLRALYRGGVHDHVGGGFFSDSGDGEWLRPRGEKRLCDNAMLALVLSGAWESGRMAFYRESAEDALDFCLRELKGPDGLFFAAQRSADGTAAPWLFTPEQLAEALGREKSRGFAECFDITPEGNFPGGASIPNLILNQRWSLLPEGCADQCETLRLYRDARGGFELDRRAIPEWNALMLASLAKCARIFSDARYLNEAEELCAALGEGGEDESAEAAACRVLALCELYRADFDPARLSSARRAAERLRERALRSEAALAAASDACLAAAALGLDELHRLCADGASRELRGAVLRELCLHSDRRSLAAAPGFCALLGALAPELSLVCLSRGESLPAGARSLLGRYAPDCVLLLKTPARAAGLAAAAPYTEQLLPSGEDCIAPFRDGVPGEILLL